MTFYFFYVILKSELILHKIKNGCDSIINFLKKHNLLEINGYQFIKVLSEDNSSAELLYENSQNRIVVEILCNFKSEELLNEFKYEVRNLKWFNKKCDNFPELIMQVKQCGTKQIYYYMRDYEEGFMLCKLIKEDKLPLYLEKIIEGIIGELENEDVRFGNDHYKHIIVKNIDVKSLKKEDIKLLDFGVSLTD